MRKTGSFELYAISAVRDTLVLLCALSELCVEDPIPIPEVFNTEDAEFTEATEQHRSQVSVLTSTISGLYSLTIGWSPKPTGKYLLALKTAVRRIT